jgi:radical SAM protein with 4Fe4S-binding SPASM domain
MRKNPFQPIYDQCNSGNSKEKLKNLPAFPRYIDIEMTNTCNFTCIMCPTGNNMQKRKKGFMKEAIFNKIIDEISEYQTPLRFIRWGEPTMHPKIIEFLKSCNDKGIITHMNTNGSYMDEEMIQKLLDVPLDSLKFSFQGVDRFSYEEMRNIDYYDELLTVIENVHRMRGEAEKPYIYISTTTTYEDKKLISSFKKEMEKIADQVGVGETVLDYIDMDTIKLKDKDRERLEWLKTQESVQKVHPECPEVFDKMSINWDGTVTACDGDFNNVMLLGDLNKQSLAEIWTGEAMQHYRSMLADMRHDELALCKHCYVQPGLIEAFQNKIDDSEN